MKLIVGLGNPGTKYEKTRHNIGFEVIKNIADNYGVTSFKKKFQGEIAEIKINNEKVILLMPQTFMNLSGNSVNEIISFYKIDVENDVIVIYDDMDLPLGKIRLRFKGSAGGHNGIKSIISHTGDKFLRIKCGIGKAETKEETINFVLNKFAKADSELVNSLIEISSKAAIELVENNNVAKIMEKYN